MTALDPAWTNVELVASASALCAAAGGLARASTHARARTCGLVLLIVGWLGLVGAVSPDSLQHRWPVLVVALCVALAIGWFAARFVAGREAWLLTAGAAVLVLRVPLPTGDGTSMLLAPLYAVTALGALALLREELRTWPGARGARVEDRGWATRAVNAGVALLPAVAATSLLWSIDRAGSIEQLAFFFVPFQLVYALVRAWVARGVSLLAPAIMLVSVTTLAAVVGLYQAATHEVWWNAKVIDANRFRPDVRTNSIFFDPNLYGRALVVGLLALVAWALVAHVRSRRGGGMLVIGIVLTLGLWHTFSQSSWFALAVALAVIAVLTLPPRQRRWTAAMLVLVTIVAVPFGVRALSGSDLEGRAEVVHDGIELAGERPIVGWGVGTFEQAALRRAFAHPGSVAPDLVASHTTPVTVAAELGVLGALAYLLLGASAAMVILARWRRSSTPASEARARGALDAGSGWPVAPLIFATGTFTALVAHSLLYAGFFEDATLWVALALLASLPPLSHAD